MIDVLDVVYHFIVAVVRSSVNDKGHPFAALERWYWLHPVLCLYVTLRTFLFE
jgi:hypothetical protein